MASMTTNRRERCHRGIFPAVAALLVVLALVAVKTTAPVSGHAEPVQSDPPAGETIAETPDQLTVIFSEEVAAEGTELMVTAPDGSSADLGDSTLDLDDLDRTTVTVGLQPDLEPGTYTVNWQSLSAEDDDRDEGNFTFNVGQASTLVASPGASPSASPVASPAASPQTSAA